MKRTSNLWFLILLCTLILFFSLALLTLPKKSFSKKENRPLASAPSLGIDALLEGKYFEELGKYCSDHFPFRNMFTSLCSISELSLGKLEVNGVIPTSEGALVSVSKKASGHPENIERINEFISNTDNTYLYVPPRQCDIFKDSLPSIYASHDNMPSLLTAGAKTNFNAMLSKSQSTDGVYYRTDHHWTSNGAYFAYTQICEQMGIESYPSDYFERVTVSADFYGTSYSKSGLPKFMCEKDTVELYRYEGDENYTVYNYETGKTANSLYDMDALGTADKYRVFMGGNYSHISITKSEQSEERERLLLIKDSYANSLLPFLSMHFDIELIDPRYSTKSYADELIKERNYDRLLIVMSFDSILS